MLPDTKAYCQVTFTKEMRSMLENSIDCIDIYSHRFVTVDQPAGMIPMRSLHETRVSFVEFSSTPSSLCVRETRPCTISLNMPSPPTQTTLQAEREDIRMDGNWLNLSETNDGTIHYTAFSYDTVCAKILLYKSSSELIKLLYGNL